MAASTASPPTKTRTSIPTPSGKWVLGKTVGAGSMGKVKIARREDGETVACKIIPRNRSESSSNRDSRNGPSKADADAARDTRTAREAAIVALLYHPYICGLRDVVRTNHNWYMLFEFVNGGQMLDYIISHGKLKEKQARKFARQIASALDYLHRNSIVHRDLKIENILISKTGDIKIIDFGLSNLFSPRSTLNTFCGSLYFAAPELLQARPYTGPEVDVWSFGIVLYVLVCGKVPFDDQSMPALHAKIKRGIVDYPQHLSPECKHLLSRMLVTDPAQRASLAEVMSHAWLSKGFSNPPESHLPVREPIRLPLDNAVLADMTGFNFGTPDAIRAQMTRVIESEDYQRAVRQWERDRELLPSNSSERRRPFSWYRRQEPAFSTPSSETLSGDPLNAYSPLISIYYLVREKHDRERRPLRSAASNTTAPPVAMPVPTSADIPPPRPAVTNASAYEMPGEAPTGGRARPRARTHGEDDAPPLIRETLASPQPSQSSPPQQHPPPSQTSPQVLAPPAAEPSTTFGSSLLRRFSTRRRKESANTPRNSMLLSPPNSGVGRSSSVHSAEPRRRERGRDRDPASDDQEPRVSLANARRASLHQRRRAREPSPSDPDLAKPVHLKGLFSVSTTSPKSVPEIRKEIRRVLNQLAVSYIEIKGGFSCRHAPSIDLAKVVDPPTPQPSKRRFSLGGLIPSSPPGDLRRDSGASSESMDNAPDQPQVTSDLGGSMVLEWDIFIVKVPLLSLHGIQFKRIMGNTWQFKSMADQILRELRL